MRNDPNRRILRLITLMLICLSNVMLTAEIYGQDFPEEGLFGASPKREAGSDLDLSSAATVNEALELLKTLPTRLSEGQSAVLREWDRQWAESEEPAADPLGQQVLQHLAASGDVRSLRYLHQVFEAAPARRQTVAVALAGYAETVRRRPEDWRLLVRSLPILEGDDTQRVLTALARFPLRGTNPQWQRQVILAGLRMDDASDTSAATLLKHWTGESLECLNQWQEWFHETYPDRPEAELPVDAEGAKHKYIDLLEFLRSEEGRRGDPVAGAKIYETAQCIRCHRFGDRGEAMGGDLTTIHRKFQDKELLQSLLFPSHIIPEEYQAKMIIDANNRRYTGVTTNSGGKLVVLTTAGEKIEITRDQIEEIRPSTQSAMPTGLLDSLTRQEIADLFAYLFDPPEDQPGY